ncbi:septum formation inhibitor Maf [Robiginitalea sp. M366]|uniref:septum formation inhibitor Maf n=1 Tax=Robiginitalea aestuariiviva TaxID=3036903 RepID=UPI00240D81D8|nr:septum formation inhibitor Maf [Robiginitalea aestuariiviva]MDG1572790.1 septum formation inhibitor Maf [Robiginitalea aestuariiviva]
MSPSPEPAALATPEPPAPKPLPEGFREYWYAGEAELSSYDLQQARYGEIHPGHAVLVFVTEPFDPQKQVKDDQADAQSVSVLKLNRTKKFLTGIYPYSIMSSIFYPVRDQQHALKATTSVQEWCGQVFAQLNNGEDFHIRAFSYFESEGDQDLHLPKSQFEDELWARLRIRPDSLPTGDLEVLPALEFLRLRHQPFRAYPARATLGKAGPVRTYTLEYPGLQRTLEIRFEAAFPHTILGWSESYPSGFGPGSEILTTTAELRTTLKSPYWQQNSLADARLRDSLGL